MSFAIKKKVTKEFLTKVISFKWIGQVKGELRNLTCYGCGLPVGKGTIAIARVKVEGEDRERNMRLCEDCGKKAEGELENEPN